MDTQKHARCCFVGPEAMVRFWDLRDNHPVATGREGEKDGPKLRQSTEDGVEMEAAKRVMIDLAEGPSPHVWQGDHGQLPPVTMGVDRV